MNYYKIITNSRGVTRKVSAHGSTRIVTDNNLAPRFFQNFLRIKSSQWLKISRQITPNDTENKILGNSPLERGGSAFAESGCVNPLRQIYLLEEKAFQKSAHGSTRIYTECYFIFSKFIIFVSFAAKKYFGVFAFLAVPSVFSGYNYKMEMICL